MAPDPTEYLGNESSRPYTRWWWVHGPFRKEDIIYQLDWLNANGFGGVELAWIDPPWLTSRGDASRPAWLSEELAELIGFTKRYADTLGLGCDFTFGSGSPIGGSQVRPEDAQQTLSGPSEQRLDGSWEPGPQLIVDHLSGDALRRYAAPLVSQLERGLLGSPSALFCDKQLMKQEEIWSPALWDQFEVRFGYRLEGRRELARTHPHMRYEYQRMVGSALLSEFFEAFAQICREQGAISRAQCHGLPVDPLAAYASVDVPETVAPMLLPANARLAASAAALAGKSLVTAELFDLLYGRMSTGNPAPEEYRNREQIADMKLVADAVLANGVSGIVWCGMPFNRRGGTQEFIPAVNVGPAAALAARVSAFNAYLETVCGMLRRGRPFAQLAVYLPIEDDLMRTRIPDEMQFPFPVYDWEAGAEYPPTETEGYHPLWISAPFLRHAEYADGQITVGGASLEALYVDVEWLDADALEEITRLARAGAPVVLKRTPGLPGMRRHPQYTGWLAELAALPNVVTSLDPLAVKPLVAGPDLPYFWAREGAGELLIFFAHPQARRLRHRLDHGESFVESAVERTVTLTYGGISQEVTLRFEPNQSLMTRLTRTGEFGLLDLDYRPPEPFHELHF